MSSIHFFRWAEQLKDSGHEVYWIDVFDSNNYNPKIGFVGQIIGWRNKINYPGRYLVKKKFPRLNNFVNKFNQRKLADIVDKKIKEIEPDVVHSFILQSAVFPLLGVMQKKTAVKWIFSAWGNDLFYGQQLQRQSIEMKLALPCLHFMFADCTRDYFVARKHGFKGEYLGTYPTGGGYRLHKYQKSTYPFESKKCIIIKGYQDNLGRCNTVLEALEKLKAELFNFKIIVFGANEKVEKFAKKNGIYFWDNFELYFHIPHKEVLELMGKSKIYIGNNISDGLPNTLLEAIIMKCFPIQSNPGGASSELIADGYNGLLIENPESSIEIKDLVVRAIKDENLMKNAIEHNSKYIVPKLEREYIRKQVLEKYKLIEDKINHKND
ncbi:glycosyltransferase family 4 protein [Salegentibacter sp. LM13S]|nr:glycosyltransferase family 4 protein [Salegentibacter lacus]